MNTSSLFSYRFAVALLFSVLCFGETQAQQKKAAAKATSSDTLLYKAPSVTITSTKAEERKTPVTFSELNREELRRSYTVQDVPALLGVLPSVVVASDNGNNVGYSYLTMRGFDQRRIAVFVNGIPQNDPEDHNVYWIDFPDLISSTASIQVQRGAGLANYGAAAIGGSVNLNTTVGSKRSALISLGVGAQEFSAKGGLNTSPGDAPQLALARTGVELSSGIVNNQAYYARISRITSRGYRDYSWADLTSYFLSAVRFDEKLVTQINVFGGPLADGLAYTGVPKSYVSDPALRRANYSYWEYDSTGRNVGYTLNRRPQEIENFSQPHYELLNDLQLSDSIQVASSLFYYTGDGFFDFDASWADAATLRLTKEYSGLDSVANPANAIIRATVSNKHGGWIPRFTIHHGQGELSVGAELRWHRSEHWSSIKYAENLPANFNPDYNIYYYEGVRNILSFFAREQYNLSTNTLLNIEAQLLHTSYGIRNEKAGNIYTSYQTTDGNIVGNGAELFSLSYLFVNPRMGLNINLDEKHNLYASLAYTSREPRMGNLYKADESYYSSATPLFESDTTGGVRRYNFSKPLIKPESMLNIETGWNYRSSSLRAGATFYLMEFRNELVKSGRRDIFGNPIDGNAPRARHLGIELQAEATLWKENTSSVAIGGNFTLSRNRLLEYSYQVSGAALNLADNPIAGFPDLLANIRLLFSSAGLHYSLSAKYIGAMYTDNFGSRIEEYLAQAPSFIGYRDNRVESAFVLNSSLSYELRDVLSLQSLGLRFQVNNLLNTLYATGGNGAEFFPAAERNWYAGIEIGL